MTDSKENATTQTDFESFKIEIKKELSDIAERLEKKIDKHLSSIKYWGIGGVILFCVIFSWLFDYKFDFTNEQNQARFEKIDNAVFISRHDAILEAIQDLKEDFGYTKKRQVSKKKSKRR